MTYTIVSKSNERRKYTFKIPVTRTEVEGAESYHLGFGLSITLPATDNWLLTPAASYGVGGSIDLAAAAQMHAASLTSQYAIEAGKWTYTIGNMFGYYRTMPFKYGEYEIDPDITNTVLRNGLMLTIPIGPPQRGSHFQFYAIDTRYYGTELFIDQYNDVGLAYGFTQYLRIGAMFILSPDSNGYSVNLGYKF